jgi:7,8-dihydro-6-hydroxymethylpterin-pyrophosphokinase
MGRVRGSDKFAPRTIDLDILTFNQEIIEPNLFLLDYLIFPVEELEPELLDAKTGKKLFEIAKEHCCSADVEKLSQFTY